MIDKLQFVGRDFADMETMPAFSNLDGSWYGKTKNGDIVILNTFSIRQSIGRRDKNNIMLFEGDKIRCRKKGFGANDKNLYTGIITWDDKRCLYYIAGVTSRKFKYSLLTSVYDIELIKIWCTTK